MRYRPEWIGRLRITWNCGDNVLWDGNLIGKIWNEHLDGATSPKGMITNLIWYSRPVNTNTLFDGQHPRYGLHSHIKTPHRSKDLAIESLIKLAESGATCAT